MPETLPDLDTLLSGVLTGETGPVARALSLVEDGRDEGADALRTLLGRLAEVTPTLTTTGPGW